MNVAYIDDEPYALENFKYTCDRVEDIKSVACFDNYIELIDYIRQTDVSIVFADIHMPGITGLELAREIKKIDETIEVVFVTGYDEYALKAFEVGALGYILKPYNKDKVEDIVSKVKRMRTPRKQTAKLEFKTFGRFDVFVGGKAIQFSNRKAKELLALLVDRQGGNVTMEQAIDALWEDRPFDDSTKTLYRIALKNMRDTLAKENCGDILIESRGQRSLDVKKVKCDYYDYLEGTSDAPKFQGEYMSDYSWGEYTIAKLMDEEY